MRDVPVPLGSRGVASGIALPAVLVTVLVAVLAATAPAKAQIAPADQVETFTRIFAFDRDLGGQTPTVVLVARDDAPGALEPVRAAFAASGARVRTTTASRAAEEIGDASVVYFDAGAVTAAAQRAVAGAGALSIAEEAALARSGQVSVALDPRPDRVGIVVSVPRLSVEKHSLSPQLLRQPWVTLAKESAPAASTADPPCQVTRFATPDYPVAARRMGVEGIVRLRVRVGPDRTGQEIEVLDSVQFLDDTAIRAAERSEYGAPGWCILAIPFKIE